MRSLKCSPQVELHATALPRAGIEEYAAGGCSERRRGA